MANISFRFQQPSQEDIDAFRARRRDPAHKRRQRLKELKTMMSNSLQRRADYQAFYEKLFPKKEVSPYLPDAGDSDYYA